VRYRRAPAALAVAVLLALAAGCDSGGVHNDGATGDLVVPKPPASTAGGVPTPEFPTPVIPTPVNVWSPRGLRAALDGLEEAAGGELRLLELVLYPQYAIAQARDPRQPANVDRYLFRAGTVDPPVPVMTFPGTNLDAETFTRADVTFRDVPRLLLDARSRVGIRRAQVTHVIIERDTVFSGGAVIVRVYAGTDRSSGYVEYTAGGRFRRVVA
jgi:hypothetical protein